MTEVRADRFVGVTSETLSRTLAKLRGEKFIRVEGKTITVLQPMQLEEVAPA